MHVRCSDCVSPKESSVRKRVHVVGGDLGVGSLLQFAEATFQPGDQAQRHQHDSATEIFYVSVSLHVSVLLHCSCAAARGLSGRADTAQCSL